MSDTENKKKPAKSSGEPPKRTAEERAWDIRRARMRRILVQFLVAVGIPTLLAIVYYGVWAADEYESTTIIVIQSPKKSDDSLGSGSFVTNRSDDVGLLRGAILSRAMLASLIESHGWREHYQEGGNMFSGLDDDAGSEKMYSYYRERVSLSSKKAVTLRVRAFSAETAEALSKAILDRAKSQLNDIALKPIVAQQKVAAERVAAAEKHLATIDSTVESARLTAAQTALASAREIHANLELHRAGQQRYLTVLSGPSRPDEARFPKRLWGIATVFVVSLALMGIFSLLLGALREHAKV